MECSDCHGRFCAWHYRVPMGLQPSADTRQREEVTAVYDMLDKMGVASSRRWARLASCEQSLAGADLQTRVAW